jgi:hypothetical protein
VDEERSTSILKWKRLPNTINEVKRNPTRIDKIISISSLSKLETGRFYTSTKSSYAVE